MGNVRFLYDNVITSSTMITVSTASTGTITQAVKDGTGSAIISLSGTYTGYEDLEYTVECDGTTAGTTVAAATIRWSDGATWDASTKATSTAASTISNGVSIAFADATMTFSTGDKWYFKGINMFSPAKMLDMDRDRRFRTGGLETTNLVNITLASTTCSTAFAVILYDHNLTSAAVITLIGATAAATNSSFSSPRFSTTIAWAANKILQYCTAAEGCRYWQIKISNTAITEGYIEIGELYLGGYTSMSVNIEEGFEEQTDFLAENNVTPWGVERTRYYNSQRTWDVNYKAITTGDVAIMQALTSAVTSRSAGTLKPFWFNLDSTQTDKTYLVKINGLRVQHMSGDRYQIPMSLKEVVRSV